MSLAGFRAKNHPQQTKRRGADDSTDDRRTRDDFFAEVNIAGRFTLDAAASHENAKCSKYFTTEENGLIQSWSAERVWCNPPYSDCGAWVGKAWDSMWSGCEYIAMLLPANRTEQKWWQSAVEPFRDRPEGFNGVHLTVRFLAGRMRFERPNWTKPAKGDRPPFGLCLLIWERV